MSAGQKIINYIESRRAKKLLSLPGVIGDFYRNGGNTLLYDVPVKTSDLVIDGGGYEGEWAEKMLIRYGCRVEVFEPIPAFAERLQLKFMHNAMVNVHATALGATYREASFAVNNNSSSEYVRDSSGVKVPVTGVSDFLDTLKDPIIACLKLNIEGGEYEVMERLLERGQITRIRALVIQFHRQPPGYEERYQNIVRQLSETHKKIWCYPMVWEKWELNH